MPGKKYYEVRSACYPCYRKTHFHEFLSPSLLWLALLCKTVVVEEAHSVLEEVGSSCKRDVELGKGRRGTASGTISCGGLALLTAEVSMVIVGLVILTVVNIGLQGGLDLCTHALGLFEGSGDVEGSSGVVMLNDYHRLDFVQYAERRHSPKPRALQVQYVLSFRHFEKRPRQNNRGCA